MSVNVSGAVCIYFSPPLQPTCGYIISYREYEVLHGVLTAHVQSLEQPQDPQGNILASSVSMQ